MSVKFLNWAFQLEGLNPTQKVILIALSDNADDEGYCFPSIATLCRKTGLASKTTIRNNLKILINKGYLSVNERLRKNGSKTSNSYILGGSYFDGGVGHILVGGGSPNGGGVGHLKGGAIEPPLEPPIKIKENLLEKEFKTLWQAYKKIGNPKDHMGDQVTAFNKFKIKLKNKTTTLAEILEGFKYYDKYLKSETWQKKKMLSTFLNNNSWDSYKPEVDEIIDIQAQRLDIYKKKGQWLDSWGEKPDE